MEKDYWKKFYRKDSEASDLLPPSQFAAFVAGIITTRDLTVIDYGCGTGRDSVFLSNYVNRVIAVDQVNSIHSDVVIKNNNLFFCYPEDLKDSIKTYAANQNICVYARFFLHAIDDKEQSNFLDSCSELLSKGEQVFFEFRVEKDRVLKKETAKHYRRYQSLSSLCSSLEKRGFDVVYSAEGRGFAVYKQDDAVVARVVAQKV